MGMTPAVSLTSQSLDPVQAFAAESLTGATLLLNDKEQTEVTYDGNPVAVTVEGATDGTYKVSYNTEDGTAPADAGSYTATVAPADDDDTYEDSTTLNFEIKAAPVQAQGPSSVTVDNLATLDGTKALALVAGKITVGDLKEGTSDNQFSVAYKAVDTTKSEITYTITLHGGNYVFAGDESTYDLAVSASEAAKPTDLSQSFPTFTYDGKTLGNNFVITVPSGSELSDVLKEYQDNTSVMLGSTNLVTDGGCTLSVADGKMTITGDGASYTNSYAIDYTVVYEFGNAEVTLSAESLTFNGKAQAPTVTVTDPATKKPIAAADYSVSYQQVSEDGKTVTDLVGQPTNAGTYNVVVTYNGQKGTKQFTIAKQDIVVAEIADIDPVTYTGQEIAIPALTVTVKYGTGADAYTQTLKAGEDYKVALTNPDTPIKNVGNYGLTITGLNNYEGTNTANLEVKAADFANVQAVLTNADELVFTPAMSDNGTNVTPKFDVTFNGEKLVAGTDYSVSPIKSGVTGSNVQVTLTSVNDNIAGTKQVLVDVLRSIEFAEPSEIEAQTWGEGDWQKPAFTLSFDGTELVEGKDYSVKYGENNVAGKGAGVVTVTGIGNGWAGTKEFTYDIEGIKAQITNVKMKEKPVYNGAVQNPADFVTFDVTYKDAETGKTVTVDPKDYTATIKTNYEFKDAKTYGLEISLAGGQYETTPYTGSITIDAADIENLDLKTTADQYLITNDEEGNPQDAEPEFVVTLNGAPYILTEDDYELVATTGSLDTLGEFEGTVKGNGNFKGSVDVAFDVAADINDVVVTPLEDVTYNGKAQTPEFKVYANEADQEDGKELAATEGTGDDAVDNYIVEWKNNTNAGTAQLVLTGKGVYGGTKTIDFTIEKAAATLEFDAPADAIYTGFALKPEPVVTLKSEVANLTSGKDFTATYGYTNNTNAGAATITVNASGEGANNYAFEAVTKDWTIAAADIAKAAYAGETTVAVGKQPAVKFTFNGKELKDGVDYKVIAAPVVSKEGKATLTVEGLGNFAGSKTITITVTNSAVKPDTPNKPTTPTVTAGWKKNSTGWWYVNANNSYPTNAWQKIDGKWFHFDKAGYMETGWQKINGAWYYLNTKHDGSYGAMLTGWQKIDGKWFYLANSGAMQTGWQKINGEWYLLNTQHDGSYGAMLTGWQKVDHATGKPTSENTWFYLVPGSGAMAANTWVGDYWVNHNGYWTATR